MDPVKETGHYITNPARDIGPIEARFRRALTFFRNPYNRQLRSEQNLSPLFRLPAEIREQISELTLSPPQGAKQPHFHIYDDVYDSCLYCTQLNDQKYFRRRPVQISLLLTCRQAYEEAKFFLWKHSKFTLVICAGNPRPKEEVYGRNCLGSITKCKDLFSRMRHVTLVVQPGKRPEATKYAARVTELLEAMDYCQHVQILCLHLNFHVRPIPSWQAWPSLEKKTFLRTALTLALF